MKIYWKRQKHKIVEMEMIKWIVNTTTKNPLESSCHLAGSSFIQMQICPFIRLPMQMCTSRFGETSQYYKANGNTNIDITGSVPSQSPSAIPFFQLVEDLQISTF